MIELRGSAWNHTRGFLPVVATAQRWEERHPEIRITWEKRSLQAFADAPMEALCRDYDLIVMDHPHTALASRAGLLLPLDAWLPAEFLADQRAHATGLSFSSYCFDGHVWALPIDTAAPIATWRSDLFQKRELALPETWEDVLQLADAGLVGVALKPIDALMQTLMFCRALGHDAADGTEVLAPAPVLTEALHELRQLAQKVPPPCLQYDPIRVAEWMTSTDDVLYCPFAYGYSNYSRNGYAANRLQAGNLVRFRGKRLRSVLGGAGLAISANTENPREAADYCAFTGAPGTQAGIYTDAGGQPGHRTCWKDNRLNRITHNYFRDTLDTLEEAILRPQHSGYMQFQDEASIVAHEAISGKISLEAGAGKLNEIYHDSTRQ